MSAIAIDFDGALGDTRPLWQAWLVDAERRYRIDGLEPLAEDRIAAAPELDERLPNWRRLLERFAEEHAAVHLRPRSDVSAALRRLEEAGRPLGAFTESPEPLARVAATQLGVARRLDALEAGAGALERLLGRIGGDALVVRTAAELAALP